MRKLLFLLPLLLGAPANAQVDRAVHEMCLGASDYAGCVQTQMSLSSKTEEAPVDTTKSESSESTAWQQHLDKNPNLKAWVEANPTLGEEKKKKWLSENETTEIERECPEACYFSPTYNQCSFVTTANDIVPCSEKGDHSLHLQTRPSNNCPPGKRQYQKTALFGLIKGEKLCLSDYEAEHLNTLNSMNRSKIINCTSSAYGSYMSTTCY